MEDSRREHLRWHGISEILFLATLRHIALNLIQKSKIPKKSIKTMPFKAALNDKLFKSILLKI
jgi:hypothetical protein